MVTGDSAREITYSSSRRSWGYYNNYGWWISITPTAGPDDTNEDHVQLYTGYQTRRQAIVTAVNAFLAQVAEDNDNLPQDQVGHRVGMIGFSGEYSSREIRSLGTNFNDIGEGTLNTYGGTYINYGLQMVDDMFDSGNTSDVAGQQRNRVVVVFTDGDPGSGNWNDSDYSHAASAISTTRNLKKAVAEGGYGATVYTVGIFPGADPSVTDDKKSNAYMNAMSSNYPDATATLGWEGSWFPTCYLDVDFGTRAEGNYYLAASNTEALTEIFEAIADQTSNPSVSLGENAQVIDEVTEYFDLPQDASEIKLQVADYDGGSFGTPYPATGVTASIEGQKVKVTGFDFDENYVTTQAKPDGNGYGKQLIITFTVTADEEFWGGNQVPTNVLATSGVAGSKGELLENFGYPYVDVPLKIPAMTGNDINVYYGAASPSTELLYTKLNYTGDWRTAFVNTPTYETEPGSIDTKTDGTYTTTATVTSKVQKEGGYNSATTSCQGSVDVFTPVLSFQDANTYLTKALAQSEYNEVGVEWKHGDTSAETVNMQGDAPALKYSFTTAPQNPLSDYYVRVSSVSYEDESVKNIPHTVDHEKHTCSLPEGTGCGFDSSKGDFIVHVFQPKIQFQDIKTYLGTTLTDADYTTGSNPVIVDWLHGTVSHKGVVMNNEEPEAFNYRYTPSSGTDDYHVNVTVSIGSIQLTKGEHYTVTHATCNLPECSFNSGKGDFMVHVFKPTITWKDSKQNYGTSLTQDVLNGHMVGSVEWKHGTVSASGMTGNAPTLRYDFTAKGASTSLVGATFTQETEVVVTVKLTNGQDVTEHTTFKWSEAGECECTTAPTDAQFRIHLNSFDLTVRKVAEETYDSGDTFRFTLTKDGEEYATFTLKAGEKVTFKNLQAGPTYTVVEDTGWSWRYTCTDDATKDVTVTGGTAEVVFTNELTKDHWLSDEASENNVFDSVNAHSTRMSDAMLPESVKMPKVHDESDAKGDEAV